MRLECWLVVRGLACPNHYNTLEGGGGGRLWLGVGDYSRPQHTGEFGTILTHCIVQNLDRKSHIGDPFEMNLPDAPEVDHVVDLWDRTNERAVLNLVSPQVQAAFLEAAEREPELFRLGEHELWMHLKKTRRMPGPGSNRLRLAFWLEYDRAQTTLKSMNMSNVYSAVCTKQAFYCDYLKSPSVLAWMLIPPTDYVTKTTEALDFGLDRLRDILSREPVDEKGRFDVRLAELQTKITWMLEQRVRGAVVQKAEVKSIGLNISTTDKAVAAAMIENSMEAMTKRLKVLEEMERRAHNLPVKSGEPEVLAAEEDVDGS